MPALSSSLMRLTLVVLRHYSAGVSTNKILVKEIGNHPEQVKVIDFVSENKNQIIIITMILDSKSVGDLSNGIANANITADQTEIPPNGDKTNEMLREMVIQKVREHIEKTHRNTILELDNRFSRMVDECVTEVKRFDEQRSQLLLLFREPEHDRRPPSSAGRLAEKVFVPCNSLLTDLFEVKHIRTIYNIFIVILLMLLLNTLVHDLVAYGSINVGLYPIRAGFGKFHIAAAIWACMQLSSFALYFTFRMWIYGRSLLHKSEFRTFWNVSCLMAFVYYQFVLVYMSVLRLIEYDVPIASSLMILTEMVRFLMKNHAFVRSNVPAVLGGKLKTDDDNGVRSIVPTFGMFVYFLFAPTLVYRNLYPRTKCIRWRRVLWNYCEVVGTIFYVSFIFERFLIPYFRDFGSANDIEPKSLVLSIFGCILPGTIANLCGFYCLLHAWMNASAEMLRFADRLFYRDWWNASSFDVYYRTWNVVVHDWLYTYVYKDMYELVFRGSKTAATLVVFSISAIFHEIILAVSFRFFYPVLFTMFQGAGVLFMFVRIRRDSVLGNIFLWFSIAFGNGLLISLYSIEYFARQNCPVDSMSVREYFVPVSWRCNGLVMNETWTIKALWSEF